MIVALSISLVLFTVGIQQGNYPLVGWGAGMVIGCCIFTVLVISDMTKDEEPPKGKK